MAHGLVEAAGRSHFRYDPKMDDVELYEAGYNRVYDTLEPERNLDFVETMVAKILKQWDAKEVVCSWKLNREIGEYLSEHVKERGILKSACKKNVPVFVPAFTRFRTRTGLRAAQPHAPRRTTPRLRYDPFEDLNTLPRRCSRRSGWASSPSAAACRATGRSSSGRTSSCGIAGGGEDVPLKRYHYGVRICPEPVNWGGLSGCPYSEAVSWGKFVPQEEGGRFAEVLLDATVGLPLIVGAVLERIRRDGK